MEAEQLLLVAGLDQFADQGGRSGEAHAMAVLASCQAEGQRDMGLAGSGVAQQQHVLAAQQELRACQFQHHGLVQRRDGEEVEAVEALDHWELRLPDAALGGAAVAVQQLQFCHAQQVAWIVDVLDGTLPRHPVVLAQEGGQAQRLQMMFEQELRGLCGSRGCCLAHADTPPSSAM